jgi:hypothetical protein
MPIFDPTKAKTGKTASSSQASGSPKNGSPAKNMARYMPWWNGGSPSAIESNIREVLSDANPSRKLRMLRDIRSSVPDYSGISEDQIEQQLRSVYAPAQPAALRTVAPAIAPAGASTDPRQREMNEMVRKIDQASREAWGDAPPTAAAPILPPLQDESNLLTGMGMFPKIPRPRAVKTTGPKAAADLSDVDAFEREAQKVPTQYPLMGSPAFEAGRTDIPLDQRVQEDLAARTGLLQGQGQDTRAAIHALYASQQHRPTTKMPYTGTVPLTSPTVQPIQPEAALAAGLDPLRQQLAEQAEAMQKIGIARVIGMPLDQIEALAPNERQQRLARAADERIKDIDRMLAALAPSQKDVVTGPEAVATMTLPDEHSEDREALRRARETWMEIRDYPGEIDWSGDPVQAALQFGESVGKGLFSRLRDPKVQIPFGGEIIETTRNLRLRRIADKVKKGTATPEELTEFETYQFEKDWQAQRPQNIPYAGAQVAADIPRYAAEYAILKKVPGGGNAIEGALLKGLRIPEAATALKAGQEFVPNAVGQWLKTSIATLSAGAVMGAENLPMVAQNMTQRMIDDYSTGLSPAGEVVLRALEKQGDDPLTAGAKGLAQSMVEMGTESFGEVMQGARGLKVGQKSIGELADALKLGFIGKWLRKKGIDPLDEKAALAQLRKLQRATGVQGLFSETVEEEVAEPLQSLIDSREYKDPFTNPEGRQRLMTEVFGIAMFGLPTQIGAIAQGTGQAKIQRQAEEKAQRRGESVRRQALASMLDQQADLTQAPAVPRGAGRVAVAPEAKAKFEEQRKHPVVVEQLPFDVPQTQEEWGTVHDRALKMGIPAEMVANIAPSSLVRIINSGIVPRGIQDRIAKGQNIPPRHYREGKDAIQVRTAPGQVQPGGAGLRQGAGEGGADIQLPAETGREAGYGQAVPQVPAAPDQPTGQVTRSADEQRAYMQTQLEILQAAGIPETDIPDYVQDSELDGAILGNHAQAVISGEKTVDEAADLVRRDYTKMKTGAKPAENLGTAPETGRILAPAESILAGQEIDLPTEGQKKAGNYLKPPVYVNIGEKQYTIRIETAKGSTRSGVDQSGRVWEIKNYPHDYGYVEGFKGADKDELDFFIGPNPESDNVFIVNQKKEAGGFDEHKVMVGFDSRKDAERSYLSAYDKNWKKKQGGKIDIVEMTPDQFNSWIEAPGKGPAVLASQAPQAAVAEDTGAPGLSRTPVPSAVPTRTPSPKPQSVAIPLSEISVDTKRFQGRGEAYSEESVQRLMDAVDDGTFKWEKFDDLQLWRDPKDQKLYVLAGHSRLVFLKRMQEKDPEFITGAPAQILEGLSEKQAIKVAKQSNVLSTRESDLDRARYYREQRESGKTRKEITEEAKRYEGKNAKYILDISHLNPNGVAVSDLKRLAKSGKENIGAVEKYAQWIGEARQTYPELSDVHENEIYRWLRSGAGSVLRSNAEFQSRLANVVEPLIESKRLRPNMEMNIQDRAIRSATRAQYDAVLEQAKKDLANAKTALEDRRTQLVRANASPADIDRVLRPLNDAVTLATQEYNNIRAQRDLVDEAEAAQGSIFDMEAEVADAAVGLVSALGGTVEGVAASKVALHGSRHGFDEFRFDKIGSGEGAQAYGYGLYFTTKKKIAEWYTNAGRRGKAAPMLFSVGAKEYSRRGDATRAIRKMLGKEPEIGNDEDAKAYAAAKTFPEGREWFKPEHSIPQMRQEVEDNRHYAEESLKNVQELLDRVRSSTDRMVFQPNQSGQVASEESEWTNPVTGERSSRHGSSYTAGWVTFYKNKKAPFKRLSNEHLNIGPYEGPIRFRLDYDTYRTTEEFRIDDIYDEKDFSTEKVIRDDVAEQIETKLVTLRRDLAMWEAREKAVDAVARYVNDGKISAKAVPSRHLYSVTLFPDREENMPKWEKPLTSEQVAQYNVAAEEEGYPLLGEPVKVTAEDVRKELGITLGVGNAAMAFFLPPESLENEIQYRPSGWVEMIVKGVDGTMTYTIPDYNYHSKTKEWRRMDIPEERALEILNSPGAITQARIRLGKPLISKNSDFAAIYNSLVNLTGAPREASEFLRKAGFDGHIFTGIASSAENYVVYPAPGEVVAPVRIEEHYAYSRGKVLPETINVDGTFDAGDPDITRSRGSLLPQFDIFGGEAIPEESAQETPAERDRREQALAEKERAEKRAQELRATIRQMKRELEVAPDAMKPGIRSRIAVEEKKLARAEKQAGDRFTRELFPEGAGEVADLFDMAASRAGVLKLNDRIIQALDDKAEAIRLEIAGLEAEQKADPTPERAREIMDAQIRLVDTYYDQQYGASEEAASRGRDTSTLDMFGEDAEEDAALYDVPLAKSMRPVRFEAGKKLTPEERREVLATTRDAYKEFRIPKVQKGIDKRGEEIYGYPYSPEFMYTSDITGRKIRYYVTLPGGRIAHPSELYPNISQTDVERVMMKRDVDERVDKKRTEELIARASMAKTKGDANLRAGEVGYSLDQIAAAPFMRAPDGGIIRVPVEKDRELLEKAGFVYGASEEARQETGQPKAKAPVSELSYNVMATNFEKAARKAGRITAENEKEYRALAQAAARLGKADRVGSEHVSEAIQYLTDTEWMEPKTRTGIGGKEHPTSGPRSPIYERASEVYREAGLPLPGIAPKAQPWQLTFEQFGGVRPSGMPDGRYVLTGAAFDYWHSLPENKGNAPRFRTTDAAIAWAQKAHKRIVREALDRGENVPASVLADYPDLEAKAKKKNAEAREKPANSARPLPATIEIDGKQRPTTNSEGRPIAATEEEVRNFYRWFGDSKVVDSEGRPLVVYHGTGRPDFDSFDLGKAGTSTDMGLFGTGIYFTPSTKTASLYAAQWTGASTGRVYPVYLKLASPIELSDWVTASLPSEIEDAVEEAGLGLLFNKKRADIIRSKALDLGYDGVVISEHIGPPDAGWDQVVEYVVYSPTQIKSATGNRGTFDVADPDITHSKANRTRQQLLDEERQVIETAVRDTPEDFRKRVHEVMQLEDDGRYGGISDEIFIRQDTERPYSTVALHELGHRFWVRYAPDALHLGILNSVSEMDRIVGKPTAEWIRDKYDRADWGQEMEAELFRIVARKKAYAKNVAHAIAGRLLKFAPANFRETTATKLGNMIWGAYRFAQNFMDAFGSDRSKYSYAVSRFISGQTDWTRHDPDRVPWLRRMGTDVKAEAIRLGLAIWNTGAMEPQIFRDRFKTELRRIDPASVEKIAPHIGRIYDAVVRAMTNVTGATTPQNLSYALDQELRTQRWNARITDEFSRVKAAEAAITKAGGTFTDDVKVYRAKRLAKGITRYRLEEAEKKYIAPLIEAIAEARDAGVNYDEINLYLIARHADERNAEVARRNEYAEEWLDGGSGMTSGRVDPEDNEAQAIMDDYRERGILYQVQKVAKAFDAVTKAERDIKRKNIEGPEAVQAWEDMFRFYVPLRTAEARESVGKPLRRGQWKNYKTKSFAGRKSLSDNPIEWAVAQLTEAVINDERNNVRIALYNAAKRFPNPDVWEVDKTPTVRSISKTTGIVREVTDPTYSRKANVVTAAIEGVEHRIELTDPVMARQFEMMAESYTSDDAANAVVRMLGKPTRWLTKMTTGYNPPFMISNFIKDAGFAGAQVLSRHGGTQAVRFLADLPHFVSTVWRLNFPGIDKRRAARGKTVSTERAPYVERFKAAGGQMGWYASRSISDIQKDIERQVADINREFRGVKKLAKWVRGAAKVIERANEAVELGTRITYFRMLVDQGVPDADAALAAREITVDFDQKGEWGRAINSVWAFSNAAIQGTVVFGRFIASPAGKKIAASIFGMSVAHAIAMRFAGGSDDDDGLTWYEKRSPWERESNVVIMIPGTDGAVVKFPAPHGLAFFWALGQIAVDASFDAAGKGLDVNAYTQRVTEAAMSAFNPLGGGPIEQIVSPTALEPFVQSLTNKTFMGSPVRPEPPPFKEVPDVTLEFRNVKLVPRAIARGLSEVTGGTDYEPGLIDVSPETIELYTDFVLGGLGKTINQAINIPVSVVKLLEGDTKAIDPRNIPGVSRLMGTTDDAYATETKYREIIKQARHVKDILKEMDPKSRAEYHKENRNLVIFVQSTPVSQLSDQLSNLRNQMRKAEDAGKYDVRDRLEKNIMQIQKRIIKRYGQTLGQEEK